MRDTILWQRFEGGLVLTAGLALASPQFDLLPIWVLILLFFSPDLSFFAYAAGPKPGAFAYNIVHTYGVGACLYAYGLIFGQPYPELIGAMLFAHAGFDRAMGYGLKSNDGFTSTHLGEIGPDRAASKSDKTS